MGVEEGWREGDGDLLRRKYSWRGYLNTRTLLIYWSLVVVGGRGMILLVGVDDGDDRATNGLWTESIYTIEMSH